MDAQDYYRGGATGSSSSSVEVESSSSPRFILDKICIKAPRVCSKVAKALQAVLSPKQRVAVEELEDAWDIEAKASAKAGKRKELSPGSDEAERKKTKVASRNAMENQKNKKGKRKWKSNADHDDSVSADSD